MSDRRRDRALRMLNEMRGMENLAVRAAGRVGRSARLASIRALAEARDPVEAVRQTLERMEPILLDAIVSGYLIGRGQVLRSVGQRRPDRVAMLSLQSRALDSLRRQQRLTADDLERIRQTFGPEASRTIAELTSKVSGKVSEAFNQIMLEQLPTRTGTKRLRKALDAAGITVDHPHMVEAIFRTEMQVSYNASRWQGLRDDPIVDEILWGFEYVAVGDDRTRPRHLALDGIRLPKDDPFWRLNWPPNGWNCRCTVLEIFHGEQRARHPRQPEPQMIDGEEVEPRPDDGWELNPGTAFAVPQLTAVE